MGQQIDLIVGLGNPDPQYLTTRHNAGFWFVDLLAGQHGASFAAQKKLFGETAEVRIVEQRIRLLKPSTYMNESGRSVAAAVNFYKIPSEHVLIVYDELDLQPGRVQLRFDGGHAGHNGMRSIIEHVGAKFWRLRLGVGRADPSRPDQGVPHVLRRASADEEQLVIDSIRDGIQALPILLEEGAERAKNQLHARKVAPDESEEAGQGEPEQ